MSANYPKRDRSGILLRRLIAVDLFLLAAVIAVVLFYRSYLHKQDRTEPEAASSAPSVEQVQITEESSSAMPGSTSVVGGQEASSPGPQMIAPSEPSDTSENTAENPAEAPSQGQAALPSAEGLPDDLRTAFEKAAADAELLAAGYDYDGAIEKLNAVKETLEQAPASAARDQAAAYIDEMSASYIQTRDSCVAIEPTEVPHIFYHSLLNDTGRAFNTEVLGTSAVDGMNAWMTTIGEFDKITQRLYDNGYVYVRLRDLVVEEKDENGDSHFTPNYHLMLPPGKKAIVLSIDDLSYYHSYKKAGFPNRLVVDENGDVKCEYTDADGYTTIGDYDVVPRLNTFLKEHPDGAYHGARGLIAMTGYNGVFGYRTDDDYELRENLQPDQADYLAEHPEYDRQTEIDQAIVVADAIKAEGWEFASHTWGHLSVTQHSADTLAGDNRRWINNVENIVGPVDTIIFAHGNDIAGVEDYSWDNDKYAMYKNAGYNFFCNVDGSHPAWIQIRDEYVRQARINLDGFMLWRSLEGKTNVLDGLIGNVDDIFDPARPTPVNAFGQN